MSFTKSSSRLIRNLLYLMYLQAHVHEAARSTAVVDLAINLNAIPRSNRSSMTSASVLSEFGNDSDMIEAKGFMESDARAPMDNRMSSPSSTVNRKNFPSPGRQSDAPLPISFKNVIPLSSSQSSLSKDGKRPMSMDVNKMVMILTAELRNCTILFINIDVDVSLVMSPIGTEKTIKNSPEGNFSLESLPFIARSSDEVTADESLLSVLQKCMEITSTSLNSNGGQIRQLICDDKGIVCIGTIGLRGSTTDDNSAAAVEAASTIIAQLQSIGLNARIGIASGKAYCGLVGSSVRHEYAVMGPCVNLSARLMCAAAAGTILCDEQTRKTDRQHKYIAKSAIAAKGYDAPVSIFMPFLPQGRVSSPTGATVKQEQKAALISTPPSPSKNILSPAARSLSYAAVKDQSNDAICVSDEESEGSVEEILTDVQEYTGQSGRSEILQDIFNFASTSLSAPLSVSSSSSASSSSSRSDTHLSKRSAGSSSNSSSSSGSGSLLEAVNSLQLQATTNTKMKIVFVSGPYGIGKSYVLKAAHCGLHTTQSHAGGLRFKFHVQASNYTKTSLFFTWKKILSNLLMRLRLHGVDPSNVKIKQSSTEGTNSLSPIPEHHTSTSTSKSARVHAHNSVNDCKASLLPTSSVTKGIKKQELLQSNIQHLISVLEPSYKDFEPLLMNGFLCR